MSIDTPSEHDHTSRAPIPGRDVESRFADTPHFRFHYVRTGTGSPVVLILGGGEWLYSYRELIPALAYVSGNILALTSITVTTGVKIFGRALARNGAVTLDTNKIKATAGVNTNTDGFPFLFDQTGTGGGPKVWIIGHHGYTPMTAPMIYCADAATGTPCPDKNGAKTWPMPLRTATCEHPPSTHGQPRPAAVLYD